MVQRYVRLERHTKSPRFLGIAHFKHPHTRYPKPLFLADLVQRYACLERHAKNPHLLALCSSNSTIPGIQKHLFWPMGYSGTGVWSATPEPKQYFLALCSSNTTIPGIQKHLSWCMVCRGVCSGPHLRNQTIFFGILQFKNPHPRYLKAPLLAFGAQWYGCLGRHPRTQTIFFGIMQFKNRHPRYPKTLFLEYGVQRYACEGRHPRTQTLFLGGHRGSFGPGPPFTAGLQLSISPPEKDPRTLAFFCIVRDPPLWDTTQGTRGPAQGTRGTTQGHQAALAVWFISPV